MASYFAEAQQVPSRPFLRFQVDRPWVSRCSFPIGQRTRFLGPVDWSRMRREVHSVLGWLGDEIPPRCIHSKLRIEVIVRADISCAKIKNHGMLVIGKYKPELSINPMTRVPQT